MIDDSPLTDWLIEYPLRRNGGPNNGVNYIEWTPQVTAPIPLEAYQYLVQGNLGILYDTPGMYQVVVLPEFFQSRPGGVRQADVTNRGDILGFFSMVLTYAKNAKDLGSNGSPKSFSKIMPRTDFTTIYNSQNINPIIPSQQLYVIVSTLACYKNTGGQNYESVAAASLSCYQANRILALMTTFARVMLTTRRPTVEWILTPGKLVPVPRISDRG